MTARCTSPFLTRPRGIASFTDTTMTSPTVAVLRFEPPSTLMHWTRRAPELSATSRLVCIWIMGSASCAGRCARRAERAQHDPALALGDRLALLDAHGVAGLEGVILVVRRVFFGSRDELLVDGMHDAPLDAHGHRLVARIADDDALEDSLRHFSLAP